MLADVGILARQPVHRPDDDELLGYVAPSGPAPDASWRALTVFGGLLAEVDDRAAAESIVTERGLASLGDRWWYFSAEQRRWRRVMLIEASPGRIVVRATYYPRPNDAIRLTDDEIGSLTQVLPDPPGGDEPPHAAGRWPD